MTKDDNVTAHADQHGLVGRGNRDGANLFREWYASLSKTAEEGGQAAYVFVMGSINEILRVFDLPVVFPEINSLQTAVRRVAHEYLGEAEDYGYSPDICGYVKADVRPPWALQLEWSSRFSEIHHPMSVTASCLIHASPA